jgi:hypothetical protein
MRNKRARQGTDASSDSFRFDLHVHTTIGSPCAFYDPFDIPRYAEIQGLSGVVITDHNFGWAEKRLSPDAYEGLSAAFAEEGLVMLVGMEVSTREGDILVYPPDIGAFVKSLGEGIGRMDFEADEVLETAHSCGALAALAHPHAYPKAVPDAIERFNGSRGVFHNPYGVPEIGGSDAHFPWGVGAAYTEFREPILDIGGIIGKVRSGLCRPVRRRDVKGEVPSLT